MALPCLVTGCLTAIMLPLISFWSWDITIQENVEHWSLYDPSPVPCLLPSCWMTSDTWIWDVPKRGHFQASPPVQVDALTHLNLHLILLTGERMDGQSQADIPQETPDNRAWESQASGLLHSSPIHNWLHRKDGSKWSDFRKQVRKSADPSEQVLFCYKLITIDKMVIIIIISSPRIQRISFAASKVSSLAWQPRAEAAGEEKATHCSIASYLELQRDIGVPWIIELKFWSLLIHMWFLVK